MIAFINEHMFGITLLIKILRTLGSSYLYNFVLFVTFFCSFYQGCIKLHFTPPPFPGRGIESSSWGRKSSGEGKGKGREEGKGMEGEGKARKGGGKKGKGTGRKEGKRVREVKEKRIGRLGKREE